MNYSDYDRQERMNAEDREKRELRDRSLKIAEEFICGNKTGTLDLNISTLGEIKLKIVVTENKAG